MHEVKSFGMKNFARVSWCRGLRTLESSPGGREEGVEKTSPGKRMCAPPKVDSKGLGRSFGKLDRIPINAAGRRFVHGIEGSIAIIDCFNVLC